MTLSPGFPTTIAWAFNWVMLVTVIIIASWVFLDTRKHVLPLWVSFGWALVSLFTFPIGLLVYLFYGRRRTTRADQQLK
jgi:ABC-type multidrug transport system permease subunit